MEDKIKSTLLKSGVPLGISTSRILQESDFNESGEVFYERDDKLHSTDIAASKEIKISEDFHVRLILILECKHRSPNKKLIFYKFPDTQEVYERSNNTDLFDETVFSKTKTGEIDDDFFVPRFANPLDVKIMHKATQMESSSSFNHSSVRKAQNQANMAALSKHIEWYDNLCLTSYLSKDESRSESRPKIFNLTLPVVVTTAEMLRFKDMGLEEVKETEAEDLFVEENILALASQNKERYLKFAQRSFETGSNEYFEKLSDIIDIKPGYKSALREWYPGFTYFVHFSALEDFLQSLERRIDDAELEEIGIGGELDNRDIDIEF